MLSEEEEIEKLKEIAITSGLVEVRKKCIDALAAYGEKAIPAILEVVEHSSIVEVRTHGLETVKKLKEKRT